MANPAIPNIYHLRTVAEVSAKPCTICFRPSTAVLITPDSKVCHAEPVLFPRCAMPYLSYIPRRISDASVSVLCPIPCNIYAPH
jgi:AAA-ATPase Vps4-associated protein 1